MIIYMIFAMGMIGLALVYDITRKKFFYNCAIIGMSLFMGLRYYVGTDYSAYNNFFAKAKDINLLEYPKDKGFLFVSQIISEITTNTRIHFIIFAFIINYLIMKFIFENSKIKSISVLIYLGLGFYFAAFNIMRQYVAIAIVVYCFKYIRDNKNIKYYIGILIATTFHYTVIFLLPLKLILDYKWTYKIYLIISGIGIYIYANIYTILNLLQKSERFDVYSDGYYVKTGANPMFLVVYITIFIFCISNLGRKGLDDIYIKSLFLGIIFLLIGTKGLIFNRIADYLIFMAIIIIPNSLMQIKYRKEFKLIIYGIFICICIYMNIFITNNGGLLPYRI